MTDDSPAVVNYRYVLQKEWSSDNDQTYRVRCVVRARMMWHGDRKLTLQPGGTTASRRTHQKTMLELDQIHVETQTYKEVRRASPTTSLQSP
jgi:hypothetical protein